jgi:hypothetical protein
MDWLKTLLRKPSKKEKNASSPSQSLESLVNSLDDILKTPGKACYSTLKLLADSSSRDEFVNFVHCGSFVGSKIRDGELVAPTAQEARQKTMLFNVSLVSLFVDGGSIEESIFLLRKSVAGTPSAHLTKFSIGRDKECDLVMIDFAISRTHALVELKREGYVITDTGSANGTFVNGVRVGREGSLLHDGDQVRFARYEFSFLSAGALFDLFKARP